MFFARLKGATIG